MVFGKGIGAPEPRGEFEDGKFGVVPDLFSAPVDPACELPVRALGQRFRISIDRFNTLWLKCSVCPEPVV